MTNSAGEPSGVGQLEKCVEAGVLRRAFPEEIRQRALNPHSPDDAQICGAMRDSANIISILFGH